MEVLSKISVLKVSGNVSKTTSTGLALAPNLGAQGLKNLLREGPKKTQQNGHPKSQLRLRKGSPPGGFFFGNQGGLLGGLLLGVPPGHSGDGFGMVWAPFWEDLG